MCVVCEGRPSLHSSVPTGLTVPAYAGMVRQSVTAIKKMYIDKYYTTKHEHFIVTKGRQESTPPGKFVNKKTEIPMGPWPYQPKGLCDHLSL